MDPSDYNTEKYSSSLLKEYSYELVTFNNDELVAELRNQLTLGIDTEYEVSDPKLAMRLAMEYLAFVFDEELLEEQQPFSIVDLGDVWHVSGSLPRNATVGGTAHVVIRKGSGEILGLWHEL